jgi:formylglycine-generating enzyme required for sulfatase activity
MASNRNATLARQNAATAQAASTQAVEQQSIAEKNSELANQQLARLEIEQLVQEGRRLKATCEVAEAITAFSNAAGKDAERGEEMAAEIEDTRRQCAIQLTREGEQLAAHNDYDGAAAKFRAALELEPPPDTLVYVWIAGGEFMLGSNEGDELAGDYEKPQHRIVLEGFWMQRTEVTNAQYRRCIEEGTCDPPGNQSWRLDQFADQPVSDVNWRQAKTYATWVGGRLPTEAEWEYACRGTDGRIYPWGNEDPDRDRLNYLESGLGTLARVGSYPPGANGLYDMVGNVWEWTSSQYGPYPYDPTDGREDPEGYASRVVRGGSFRYYDHHVRCARRFYNLPDYRNINVGFRVVVSPDGWQ